MIEYGLLKELRQVLFRNHFNLQKYSSLPEVVGIKKPAIRWLGCHLLPATSLGSTILLLLEMFLHLLGTFTFLVYKQRRISI